MLRFLDGVLAGRHISDVCILHVVVENAHIEVFRLGSAVVWMAQVFQDISYASCMYLPKMHT